MKRKERQKRMSFPLPFSFDWFLACVGGAFLIFLIKALVKFICSEADDCEL